jgi:hypothetical protein
VELRYFLNHKTSLDLKSSCGKPSISLSRVGVQ